MHPREYAQASLERRRLGQRDAAVLVVESGQPPGERRVLDQYAGVGRQQQYRVIYNAIDSDAFRRKSDAVKLPDVLQGKLLVGTAASLTPEKGLDVLTWKYGILMLKTSLI